LGNRDPGFKSLSLRCATPQGFDPWGSPFHWCAMAQQGKSCCRNEVRYRRSVQLANAIAEAFGLGDIKHELVSVVGGRSHLVWRLETERGTWAVKQLNRSRESWWTGAYLVSVDIEKSAFERGVAMPEPVVPMEPSAPFLADIAIDGSVKSFRVHGWCSGHRLSDVNIDDATLTWVGRTLSALHQNATKPNATDAPSFDPHPVEDWIRWLDEDTGEFGDAVRTYLPHVAEAIAIIGEALRSGGGVFTPVLTHRDVKPDNILLTPGNPVLLDWDSGGVDLAEWELVRAALDFCRIDGGRSKDAFQRVIRSYNDAGGAPVAHSTAVLGGVLHSQLASAAYFLWRGLGHRPVTAKEREASREYALETLCSLKASLSEIERWTQWLCETQDR
jgi:hypothetical protein